MIGTRFTRWVVIAEAARYVAPNGRKNRAWLCRCDCGVERVVTQMRLRSGDSKSCGCLKAEKLAYIRRTHGHFSGRKVTPTLNSWRSMMLRCNPSYRLYKDYGGRGIKICERWHKFENFLEDMGERPPGTTLERIDVNGYYEPGNCRWATRLEQGNNKRNNRFIDCFGKRVTLAEAERITGVPQHTIAARIKRGWSVCDALTKPPRVLRRAKRAIAT